MNTRPGILIVSVTIFVLCLVVTASATNWSVDGSGEADFTGIQDAINNASDGDTILVYFGLYHENVVVDKSVMLKGIDYPVVDAGREESAITLTADGITLEGFNITNAGSLWPFSTMIHAGINVISNSNTITGNNVCNNNDDGIRLDNSSNNTITGNNVCNNNNGYGINIHDSCNNTLTGNNVRNNRKGIRLYYSSNNILTGNNVSNIVLVRNANFDSIFWSTTPSFDEHQGIYLSYSYNNTIAGNNVCNNNQESIHLSTSSNNNIITGNNVCNNRKGIYLSSSSNNNITGNNASNNNGDGIRLDDSSNSNTITGNNVSTTRKASASTIPATTTQSQATMSATTTGVASNSTFLATTP